MQVTTAFQIAICAVVAAVLSWVMVWPLRTLGPRWGLVDVPNKRSSHEKPTPRAGGLAFAVASPVVALLASRWIGIQLPAGTTALLAGAALVAATGLADDKWGLPVRARFGAYVAAAVVLIVGAGYLDRLEWPNGPTIRLGWVGIPFTILWIVGLTNAYNFMDGIDGIASVQAVVSAGAVSLIFLGSGDPGAAIYTAPLAGGVLGFLLHNWPPARIFMGDVGSAFLGYSFAGLAVICAAPLGGTVPFVVWVVLLAPFLFDTALTLVLRIARGERWYEAHRQHLYQRLVRRGWPHLAVMTVYLCTDLFLAGLVLAHFTVGLGFATVALLTAAPLLGMLGLVKLAEGKS